MATIADYIDFSENEELWKEAERMDGLGEAICREIRDEDIQAVVRDYIEDKLPTERILAKLQKIFGLTEEMSKQYYQKCVSNELP